MSLIHTACVWCAYALSVVPNSVTPWTIACQAPLSMQFSRQESWSRLPLPFAGIFLTQGSNLRILHLLYWQVGSFPSESLGKPLYTVSVQFSCSVMSDSLWPHGLQHTRLPCPYQLPEPTQTHVHWVGDTIQPSHPLSSPSPPAFNLSQHQGLFNQCTRSTKQWHGFETPVL